MSKATENRYVTPEQVVAARKKIMDQAKAKGINPYQSVDPKFADLSPDDESVDEFIKTLRNWRHEAIVDK